MFEIVILIAVVKSFIATAMYRVIHPLRDGCEKRIVSFNVPAFGLSDHTAFALDGYDAVIPVIIGLILSDGDKVIGADGDDLPDGVIQSHLTDAISELTIAHGLLSLQ